MTVTAEVVTHSYYPGDAMAPEAIPFEFLNPDDLIVADQDGILQQLSTDFVITGNSRTREAKITTLHGYDSNVELKILRKTTVKQQAVTDPFKPLPAESVGRELDRQSMVAQEHGERLSRVPELPRYGQFEGSIPVVVGDGFEFLSGETPAARYVSWTWSDDKVPVLEGQRLFPVPDVQDARIRVLRNTVELPESAWTLDRDAQMVELASDAHAHDIVFIETIGNGSTLLRAQAGNVRASDIDGAPSDVQAELAKRLPIESMIGNFENGGLPMAVARPWSMMRPDPSPNDGFDFQYFRRHPAGASDAVGWVNTILRILGESNPESRSIFWPLLTVLIGRSDHMEDVSHYAQTHKYGQGHHGATCIEMIDHVVDPLRGSVVQEIDHSVMGSGNTDAHGNRHLTHYVARPWVIGDTGVEVASHILFTTEAGCHLGAVFKRGAGGGTVDKLFDFPDFQMTFAGQAETRRMTIGRAGGATPIDYSFRLNVDSVDVFNLYADAGNNTVLAAGGQAKVVLNGAAGTLEPLVDNVTGLGKADKRFTQLAATTATINTSDARFKTVLRPFTDDELDAIGEVQTGIYQWLDAVAIKGEDGARLHAGAIAQQLATAMAARGLDASRYAWWCADPVTDMVTVEIDTEIQDSETVQEMRPEIVIVDGVAVRRMVAHTATRLLWDDLPIVEEDGTPVMQPAQDEVWGHALKDGAEKGSKNPDDYEPFLIKPARPERPAIHTVPRMKTVKLPTQQVQPRIDPETGEPMIQLGLRYTQLLVAMQAWSRRELERLAARVAVLEAAA